MRKDRDAGMGTCRVGLAAVKNTVLSLIALGSGIGLMTAAFFLTRPVEPEPVLTGESASEITAMETRELGDFHRQRETFLKQELLPLVAEEAERNRLALEQARQELSAVFQQYKAGIPGFLEDLTSWGTRYRIAKATLGDWWAETNEAREITTKLFEEHVVSDSEMEEDLARIVARFASDLEANRNQMLGQAAIRMESADFSLPAAIGEEGAFAESFEREDQAFLAERARLSPAIGVLAIAGGFVTEETTRYLVTQLVRVVAVRLSAAVPAAGGAAAGTAAAGAGSGTLITPGVGTAIGLVCGLAVGFAVDMWMEQRFETKVAAEVEDLLARIEEEIWDHEESGLAIRLQQSIDAARESHEATMKTLFLGKAIL